jgi:hypothetical protein
MTPFTLSDTTDDGHGITETLFKRLDLRPDRFETHLGRLHHIGKLFREAEAALVTPLNLHDHIVKNSGLLVESFGRM